MTDVPDPAIRAHLLRRPRRCGAHIPARMLRSSLLGSSHLHPSRGPGPSIPCDVVAGLGEIVVKNFSRAARVDRAAVASLVADLGEKMSANGGCSVVFVSDARMHEYNRRYRAKDGTTDVLSFPAGSPGYLGDIVISMPQMLTQAHEAGKPAAEEARHLIIHGFLHLLGYDHETDHGEMRRLEARLMRDVASGGLICAR